MSLRTVRAAVGGSLVAATATLIISGCAAHAPQRVGNRAPAAVERISVVPLVDTIARRLADLEVQRVATRTLYTAEFPGSRDLDALIASLNAQLESAGDAGSRQAAIRHVIRKLDERQAGLVVERRQQLVKYNATQPAVVRMADEIQLIDVRRTELRSALASLSSNAHD